MYSKENIKVKSLLKSIPGRISLLTFDLWSSITTDGYICLTAHFIDKDWMSHKKILSFSSMPPPQNGVNLAKKIYTLLFEWGIENKVFALTLDNASANKASIDLLTTQLNMRKSLVCNGEYFHIRCCAHILNLIVQDGLKEIDESVCKIRESIKYVRGSQAKKKKWLECIKHSTLDGKKGLRQDVPTRWNSTFLMLESALFYKRDFQHLELSDSNYTCCPSRSEWEKVERSTSF